MSPTPSSLTKLLNQIGRSNRRVTRERVHAILSDGSLVIHGHAIPTTGVDRGIEVGQHVEVLWRNDVPTAVLRHSAKRAQPVPFVPQAGGGVIEELFLNEADEDVYLRTQDAVVKLNLADVIDQAPTEVARWGTGHDRIFIRVPEGGNTDRYAVVTLDRDPEQALTGGLTEGIPDNLALEYVEDIRANDTILWQFTIFQQPPPGTTLPAVEPITFTVRASHIATGGFSFLWGNGDTVTATMTVSLVEVLLDERGHLIGHFNMIWADTVWVWLGLSGLRVPINVQHQVVADLTAQQVVYSTAENLEDFRAGGLFGTTDSIIDLDGYNRRLAPYDFSGELTPDFYPVFRANSFRIREGVVERLLLYGDARRYTRNPGPGPQGSPAPTYHSRLFLSRPGVAVLDQQTLAEPGTPAAGQTVYGVEGNPALVLWYRHDAAVDSTGFLAEFAGGTPAAGLHLLRIPDPPEMPADSLVVTGPAALALVQRNLKALATDLLFAPDVAVVELAEADPQNVLVDPNALPDVEEDTELSDVAGLADLPNDVDQGPPSLARQSWQAIPDNELLGPLDRAQED